MSKYMDAQEKIGVVMQKANEQQAAQAQQMMEMQKSQGK